MPKHCAIWLMTLGTLASGQTAAPSFRADRVLYGGSDRVKPLAPGMDFSIYGKELFGCNDVEIRQNGVELQRIPFIDRGTHVGAGNPCGHDTVEPGYSVAHAGRLPLHLKYRFEKPGFYQLRYTQIMHPQASVQSDWTTIDVQPAQFEALPSAPAAPYEIMSDFLPNLLAVRDMETRAILARYLKDSNEEVRRYATASLDYWP